MRRLAARLPAVRRSVVDYWTRSPPVLQGIARVFAVAAGVVIGAHAPALEPAEGGARAADLGNNHIRTRGGGPGFGGPEALWPPPLWGDECDPPKARKPDHRAVR